MTFRQLNLGANMSLGKCLQMEYQAVHHFFYGSDFHEGVRALLIDKDRNSYMSNFEMESMFNKKYFFFEGNPKWNPPRIEDVSTEKVLSYFKPVPSGDQLPM